MPKPHRPPFGRTFRGIPVNFPENPAGFRAAQAQALARENDPAGFMAESPSFERHGFDIDTGNTFETWARVRFGAWQDSDLDGKDADLAILRGIHDRAVGHWRGLPDTLRSVRDDDDPTLNADGRLRTAARILEPKLKALEDLRDRELPRIAAEAEREVSWPAWHLRKWTSLTVFPINTRVAVTC